VRLLRQRLAALSPLAVALVACSDATGPTPEDVRAHRANWLAHHLTEYTYIYETRGFSFPTVDKLFDQAADAARDHSLRAISFEGQLSYPRRIYLDGAPDA
jgi:hypothetical protein